MNAKVPKVLIPPFLSASIKVSSMPISKALALKVAVDSRPEAMVAVLDDSDYGVEMPSFEPHSWRLKIL